MKLTTGIVLIMIGLLLACCEQVIPLDIPEGETHLVIEASVDWQKGTLGNYQYVRLSTTTSFYATEIPAVSGAEVKMTNSHGTEFIFDETPGGFYVCNFFQPELLESYTLTVKYNKQLYTSVTTLLPVADLLYAQETFEGLTSSQATVKAYFTDPEDEENYYMQRFTRKGRGQSAVFDDEWVNGNLTYTVRFYDQNELQTGDTLDINLYGVTRPFYDYMTKLIAITSDANVGPFQVPAGTVRGNIINESNAENYALGYFRAGEVSNLQFIVP